MWTRLCGTTLRGSNDKGLKVTLFPFPLCHIRFELRLQSSPNPPPFLFHEPGHLQSLCRRARSNVGVTFMNPIEHRIPPMPKVASSLALCKIWVECGVREEKEDHPIMTTEHGRPRRPWTTPLRYLGRPHLTLALRRHATLDLEFQLLGLNRGELASANERCIDELHVGIAIGPTRPG